MARIALVALTIVIASACNYHKSKGGDTPATGAKASFADVREKVFAPACFSCHSAAGNNEGGLNLETYEAAKAHADDIRVRAVERKDMPVGGSLSLAQLSLLKAWLDEGAPEAAPAALQGEAEDGEDAVAE